MGTDVYLVRRNPDLGDDTEDEGTDIVERSKKHPEHLFKLGRFIKDFMPGGNNTTLNAIAHDDLNRIFDVVEDRPYVHPDWPEALQRCHDAIERLDRLVESYGPVRAGPMTTEVPEHAPDSEEQALALFLDEYRAHKDDEYRDYECTEGAFILGRPMALRGLIRGTWLGEAAVFLIYNDSEPYRMYRESLEIVAETIEWVLAQPDPQWYCLDWGG